MLTKLSLIKNRIKLFVFACISVLLLVYGCYFQRAYFNDYLFYPYWSIEELQDYFTGRIPEDARNIHYEGDAAYGLLTFEASPNTAMDFSRRFCSGFFYQGYNPFYAQDGVSSQQGHLIKTERSTFYYSYSPNTPETVLGNRCSVLERGGLHQIMIDQTNNELYKVSLEISSNCYNQRTSYPCDGQHITYVDRGVLLLNRPQDTVSQHAIGERWEIEVTPNKMYEIEVLLANSPDPELISDQLNLMILPILSTGNEPYCEACWVEIQGAGAPDGLTTHFMGSPTGRTAIRIFWMGRSEMTYTIEVRDKSD